MGSKNLKSDEWLAIVGEGLKQLRIEKGYSSYEAFSLDNNLDRKQYWRIENGSNLTLKTLIKILHIHNKTLPEFFSSLPSSPSYKGKK